MSEKVNTSDAFSFGLLNGQFPKTLKKDPHIVRHTSIANRYDHWLCAKVHKDDVLTNDVDITLNGEAIRGQVSGLTVGSVVIRLEYRAALAGVDELAMDTSFDPLAVHESLVLQQQIM